jgi:hypothetical protein
MDHGPHQPRTNPGRLRPRRGLRAAGVFAALLVGLAVILAACGGGSNPGSSSATSSSAPSASTSSPASGGSSGSSGSSQSGAVAFAQCVRSHGVPDFPDPQNGHFLISGADQNNPNFQSATQACQHLLPSGSATNGGSGSNSSAELAFAHCMQTHGVPNFPDPTSNGALGIPQGVNANSPQFQTAYQACSSLLPNNGAGLGG